MLAATITAITLLGSPEATPKLPLGLSSTDITHPEITYIHGGGKPGQIGTEITFSGAGFLHKKFQPFETSPVKNTEARLERRTLLRLLRIMEMNEFLDFSESNPLPGSNDHWTTVIKLRTPTKNKSVSYQGGNLPGFQRIEGALQFVALRAGPPAREALPFDLHNSSLGKVEIHYFYGTQKPNGEQYEIILSGSGRIKVILTPSRTSKEIVVDGNLEGKFFKALLLIMQDNGFLNLNDEYSYKGVPKGFRRLRLSLPGRKKEVVLKDDACPEFERIGGAIRLVTGLVLPKTLDPEFMPNF